MNPLAREQSIQELADCINEEHNKWQEEKNFYFPDFARLMAEKFLSLIDLSMKEPEAKQENAPFVDEWYKQ
jgi:hypothetical protein